MGAMFIIIAVLAVAATGNGEDRFYNWTQETVVNDFTLDEFSSQHQWYELKWWANESEPNALDNMFFFINTTSTQEASVVLVGTKPSEPDKCVYLSGKGDMKLIVREGEKPAKMIYRISTKYADTPDHRLYDSKFNIIAKGSLGHSGNAKYLVAIQCQNVEPDGTCSRGLKVNFFCQVRILTNFEDKIDSILENLAVTPRAADYVTTKQNKICKYPPDGRDTSDASTMIISTAFVVLTIVTCLTRIFL